MTIKNSTIEKSYLKHIDTERNSRILNNLPSTYTNPTCIDAWRHDRMRNKILPIINHYPKSKWITIGDGTFGNDAYYLQNKGLYVLSTSISDETLSVAKKLGYINKYKRMNAEDIPDQDNSYDFVFCKESYHHFPRPNIALYEMIRVANKGVILIEPQENNARLFDFLKKAIKTVIRKDSSFYFEEKWGNYIYRININEISKVMIALNLKYIAYSRFNDFYFPPLSNKSAKGINIFKTIFLLGIGIQNLLCKLRLMNFGLVTVVLLKNDVDDSLLKDLSQKGFRIKKLPINPYILKF